MWRDHQLKTFGFESDVTLAKNPTWIRFAEPSLGCPERYVSRSRSGVSRDSGDRGSGPCVLGYKRADQFAIYKINLADPPRAPGLSADAATAVPLVP